MGFFLLTFTGVEIPYAPVRHKKNTKNKNRRQSHLTLSTIPIVA
ncbi:hypothetical protein B835_2952 [Enterococcus mundtii 3F]|nr:hypothetical protein [Enterococcus mundtii 3F]